MGFIFSRELVYKNWKCPLAQPQCPKGAEIQKEETHAQWLRSWWLTRRMMFETETHQPAETKKGAVRPSGDHCASTHPSTLSPLQTRHVQMHGSLWRACWWLALRLCLVPGGDLCSIQRVGILSQCRASSLLPALASTWKHHCHLRPRPSKANWSSPPRACPLLACFESCTGVEARTPNIVGSSSCSHGPISLPPMVALSMHPPHGLPPPHSFSPCVPQNSVLTGLAASISAPPTCLPAVSPALVLRSSGIPPNYGLFSSLAHFPTRPYFLQRPGLSLEQNRHETTFCFPPLSQQP